LDIDQILNQFEAIEQKVERVIEVCKTYEASNLELKNKVQSLEEELHKRVEAEKRYKEERTLIRSKIDHLLAKLDDLKQV
jgi:cell division protein ZapB